MNGILFTVVWIQKYISTKRYNECYNLINYFQTFIGGNRNQIALLLKSEKKFLPQSIHWQWDLNPTTIKPLVVVNEIKSFETFSKSEVLTPNA